MDPVPRCPACMGRLCDTTQRHGLFAWAVAWRCPTCDAIFHCCDRTCDPKTQQITAFTKHSSLIRHHRRKHKPASDMASDDADAGGAFFDDPQPSDELDRTRLTCYPIPSEAFDIFLVHLPTKRFFDDLQHHSFAEAVQGMVARSCYLDARMRTAADHCISVTDLTLYLRIARLVFQLGPKHQHLLGGVLSGFETRYPLPGFATSYRSSDGLQLPTTHKAFVAKLLNQTNTNSLTSIIPLPPTVGLSGKHAYVSIPSLVAYDLGLANADVDPPYKAGVHAVVQSSLPHRQMRIPMMALAGSMTGAVV
jgi:hypothetical protein